MVKLEYKKMDYILTTKIYVCYNWNESNDNIIFKDYKLVSITTSKQIKYRDNEYEF